MKLLSLLFALCLVTTADAQIVPAFTVAKSRSGQFTVRAIANKGVPRSVTPPKMPIAGTWAYALQPSVPKIGRTNEMVELEPALLAIGCERLKDALLKELSAADSWRGNINVMINSSLPEGDEPFLDATLRPGGWTYAMEVPRSAKPDRLLRSLVHVMLLEMANRGSTGETTQVPLWLVEGMTAHLRAFNLQTFLVQEKVTTLGNRVKLDALDSVRQHLRKEPALTFQALSWPEVEKADNRTPAIFCDSSQLLVYQLLHFKNGRTELRNMIAQLPAHQNWQFAFLNAFRAQFQKPLDVEKWWALTCVSFSGNQIVEKWSPDESRARLRDLLEVPAEFRAAADQLPVRSQVTLQEVIRNWQQDAESAALQRTITGLETLRWHSAPEIEKIAAGYETALRNYLNDRERKRFVAKSSRIASLKKNVCRELDKLDAQRDSSRKQQIASQKTQKFAEKK
jgi:hypothetical protein